MATAVLIGSTNALIGFEGAMRILRHGGSALDAVIAAIRPVEANPDDHSVGYSGLPNLLGDVELDASLMDGLGLRAGSVGALQGYQDAIDLARRVMDDLPHVLIAGAGAARLAGESGFTPRDLSTPEAMRIWRSRLTDMSERSAGEEAYAHRVRELVKKLTRDPELPDPPHGTVNVIALDQLGNLATGVSTSGWAWKYPGRLGDSPVIGAGNYADNRWGAAACTGRGEMAQRCCTAHSVVTFMRFGMDVADAARQAMEDLRALDDPYASEMNLVALDPAGNYAAASSTEGKTYIMQGPEMSEPAELIRLHVPRDC
ncbi:MAG: N(4)-(beta-N-acetylglucosaminyl)-L-asparaginase [Chloroflexota bacterium]|nr:N(4)-(beta-N-acetylglucosaminyl)-L-asparaginase [Chloroflexota bacterium]